MQVNIGMLKDMGAGSGGNIEWSFVDLQLQTVVCVGPSNLVKGLPYLQLFSATAHTDGCS